MKTVSQDMQGTVGATQRMVQNIGIAFIQQSLHYLLVIHQIQVNCRRSKSCMAIRITHTLLALSPFY